MRGMTVQKLSVFPFQHNPINQTLTVTQNLEIELTEVADTYETSAWAGSRAFESIYENLITNYSYAYYGKHLENHKKYLVNI